jgi:hypothetical protein
MSVKMGWYKVVEFWQKDKEGDKKVSCKSQGTK